MIRPQRILVIGGGSSSWMAAAYLNAALNQPGFPRNDITVLEEADRDGVDFDEPAVHEMQRLFAVIGVEPAELMRSIDATFMQSTRYVNWLDGTGEHFHHPFSRVPTGPIDLAGQLWLRSDRSIPFMETVSAQPAVCEMGLSPLPLDPAVPGPPLKHSYHMSRSRLADYLAGTASARGVKRISDNLADVEMAENGDIRAINTRSGQRIEADLFIDGTGFAAELIGKRLGVPWVDCSKWLLCNRLVTMDIPYEVYYPGSVHPYTTATALSAGRAWDIPLRSKRALGYVYSDAFIDTDRAISELREFEGPHAAELDTRVGSIEVGRREQIWSRNCIAIGSAGHCIEPMSPTSLYLDVIAAVLLAEHFPRDGDLEPLAMRVNRLVSNRFYEVLDFANLHYALTRRTDSDFWLEAGRSMRVTERLQAKLDYWRIKPPSASDFEDQFFPSMSQGPTHSRGDPRSPVDTGTLWGQAGYEAALYGMDFLADECQEWFGSRRPRPLVHGLVLEFQQKARKVLPRHEAFLRMTFDMPEFNN